MRALCAALACGSAHAQQTPSPGLPPEIDLQETRLYYDLDATGIDSMRRQLEARAPRTLAGRVTPGLTRQSLYVQYRLQPSEDGCTIEGIGIETRIDIHLPRWRPKGAPAEDLQARWPTLETLLAEHEQGHRDNGVRASLDLLQRLRALGRRADCAELADAATSVRRQALVELRAREDAYDRETDYGRIRIKAVLQTGTRPARDIDGIRQAERARSLLGGR